MKKEFTYQFDQGPLLTREEVLGDWNVGNCRRAVQFYILNKKNVFLKTEQVLCPDSYKNTGSFVIGTNQEFSPGHLLNGDIIYAEKIRDKKENIVDKSLKTFITA